MAYLHQKYEIHLAVTFSYWQEFMAETVKLIRLYYLNNKYDLFIVTFDLNTPE